MTSTLFLAFVALTVAILIAGIAHYLNRRTALGVLAGLSVWLVYTGSLASFGVLTNTTMRPPGIAFLGVPVILFLLLFIVRTSARPQLALAFPLWILLGTQCFRIIVELFLHQLWLENLVPRMLTFNGANLDIYIGATAPLIAWWSTRGRWGANIALAWNILGLLVLANVVVRAVLTTPRPTQPHPRRDPRPHVEHLSISLHPRILRAAGSRTPHPRNSKYPG